MQIPVRPAQWFFLAILLLFPLRIYAEDAVVRVFTLNYINAGEAQEIIKPLLSSKGRISAHAGTNTLLVKDMEKNISAIAALLKEIDKMPEQVRIKAEFIAESTLKKLGVEIKWKYVDKDWSIGNVFEAGGEPARRAGRAGQGLNITALIEERKEETKTAGTQNILVMSGKGARIAVGKSIPYVDWFYHYSKKHGYIKSELKFKEAMTGFSVTPTVMGENISIEITPEASYVSDKGDGTIVFREASTSVVLKDKESLVIAGGETEADSLITRILEGVEMSGEKEGFYMVITAEKE